MKALRMLLGIVVAWMAAGCHLAVPTPEDAGKVRRFTQVSLFSTLLCGRYGGVVDLGWVKSRGNLMIATMDRLDGEVMMVDGVVYQVRSDGTVRMNEFTSRSAQMTGPLRPVWCVQRFRIDPEPPFVV